MAKRKTVKQLEKEIRALKKQNKELEYKIEILSNDVQYHAELEAGAGI